MGIHHWRCAMAVACVGVAMLGAGVRADETVIDTTAESVLADSPTHSTCAMADRAGNIWIGSEDGDLRCYHPASKSWTHYTQADGLGDDYVYALCCDRAGRIWAGHLNHGVSVFDGKSWRNYSNAGKNAGPLGTRVYAMATSPTNGDVWMATEAGLSRYSEETKTWTHYTRAEGLPENEARGIAIDREGDVYVGLATEGAAIGRAADGFNEWEQIKGPAALPRAAKGDGLPGNLTTCVTVDGRDHVYVGTTSGLARSDDHGRSWQFMRGKDWVDLVNGENPGAAEKFTSEEPGTLNEDWVTTVESDEGGTVWVGYRKQGYQRLDPATKSGIISESAPLTAASLPAGTKPHKFINCVTAMVVRGASAQPLVCRYDALAAWCTAPDAALLAPVAGPPMTQAVDFPAAAPVATAEQLRAMTRQLSKLNPRAMDAVAYLGEDWTTQGNWIGRYGRLYATLLGIGDQPADFGDKDTYKAAVSAGPHIGDSSGAYWNNDKVDEPKRRVLWNPLLGKRIQGEINDESYDEETWPAAVNGRNLFVRVDLPEGPHRVSLYFSNFDGHSGRNAYRDFVVEVRKQPGELMADPPAEGRDPALALAETAPVLLKTRVSQYWGGVYKRFLFSGKGTYWIKIVRNHSFVTKVQAVFVDPADTAQAVALKPTANDPPPMDNADIATRSPIVAAAADLMQGAHATMLQDGWENVALRYQLAAYRAAAAAGASEPLLARWRWMIPLCNAEDSQQFELRMKSDFERTQGAADQAAPVAP